MPSPPPVPMVSGPAVLSVTSLPPVVTVTVRGGRTLVGSQSPATGAHPGPPYANGVKSGAPGVLLFRGYQVAEPGSKAPTVVVPLPSQSPTTGAHPGAP